MPVVGFTFLVYDGIQLENLFEILDRQAHDNKPYSSMLLQDESADSSLVILGAVLRGKTVLVLTHNDGLFVWENGSQCSIVQNVTLNGHNASNMPRGECLAMRGALVAIGTRSGAVYIYHIDGKWKNQFSRAHTMLEVSKSPINAVALDDDGLGSALVAAGEDGIIRVHRWFPPSVT